MSPTRKPPFKGKASWPCGSFLRTAGIFLAGVVLLAASLWLEKRDAGASGTSRPEPRVKGEWTPAEFGGFGDGSVMDQTPAFDWEEVPPFRVDAGWKGLEATNAESDDSGEIEAEGAAEAEGFLREENWREPTGFFFRPDTDPRVIRYKIDSRFGFENRERFLKGMMIRVQVRF